MVQVLGSPVYICGYIPSLYWHLSLMYRCDRGQYKDGMSGQSFLLEALSFPTYPDMSYLCAFQLFSAHVTISIIWNVTTPSLSKYVMHVHTNWNNIICKFYFASRYFTHVQIQNHQIYYSKLCKYHCSVRWAFNLSTGIYLIFHQNCHWYHQPAKSIFLVNNFVKNYHHIIPPTMYEKHSG